MATQWFVHHNGKLFGPFDSANLRNLAATGKITGSTLVSQVKEGPWRAASTLQGLFGDTCAGPSKPVSPSEPAASARPQKGTYGSVTASAQGPPPPLPTFSALSQSSPASPAARPASISEAGQDVGPSSTHRKKPWGAIGGGVGGAIGICVLAYNVAVVSYNGYLRTDLAAINLLKTSIKETFESNPDVAKPVAVLDVTLEGSGAERTGRAVVTFAGEAVTLPIKATVKKTGRDVEVSWETLDEPVEAQQGDEDVVVTRANYESIEDGAAYDEVVEIIGSNGVEQSSTAGFGNTVVWMNGDGSGLIIVFHNGKVANKTIVGFLP
jgi:hypothetical protein